MKNKTPRHKAPIVPSPQRLEGNDAALRECLSEDVLRKIQKETDLLANLNKLLLTNQELIKELKKVKEELKNTEEELARYKKKEERRAERSKWRKKKKIREEKRQQKPKPKHVHTQIIVNGNVNNSNLNTGSIMKFGKFTNQGGNVVEGDQYNATGGATQNNHCTINESKSAPLTVTDTKVKEAIITLRQENKWEKQMYWAVWKVLMARKIVNKRAEEFANYLINIGAEKDNVYNNIRRIDTECNNIAHVTATQWTDYYDRYDGNHNKQILVAKRFIELLDS